jgi:hypothetical protein
MERPEQEVNHYIIRKEEGRTDILRMRNGKWGAIFTFLF